MKRLPIALAERVCKEAKSKQIIILAWDADGTTHVVTYGVTKLDCEQAATGGKRLADFMGLKPLSPG